MQALFSIHILQYHELVYSIFVERGIPLQPIKLFLQPQEK